ncbi:Nse4 C-terminal-domain-containing protein [Hyaloraphidium curvatum]|nr:Nse4 C-terminal-domain-containing protein [Hyaloraphidium curvatum]
MSRGRSTKGDEATLRRIRGAYRAEISELDADKEELSRADGKSLTPKVRKLNVLFEEVHRPQEAVLDAKALKMVADIGAERADKLARQHVSLNVDEFVRHVGAKLEGWGAGNASAGWVGAGRLAFGFCRRPPTTGFMLGTLQFEPRERKKRKPAERKKKEEAVVVKEERAEQATQETTKLVREVYKSLDRAGGPVDLIRFIANADPVRGFGQTVENLFYVSFLVRDNRVRCFVKEEDGLLYIETYHELEEGYRADDNQAKQGNRQLLVNLTQDMWEDAIDLYGIDRDKPMIPNRAEDPAARNVWQ